MLGGGWKPGGGSRSLPTIQPVESPSVKVERVAFEAMVRRSFRVGLRLGLLVGVAFALVKTVQARRSTPSAPPERLSRQGTAAFIRRSCTSYFHPVGTCALECPIHLEAKVSRVNPVMADEYDYSVHERSVECTLEGIVCIEVRITRVHAHPSVLMDGKRNRIDPDRWRPLIMSFQRFYGLGPELSESRLAGIPEAMYRTPDIDRANVVASEK